MDLTGFFKTGNADFLFFPQGEYDLRRTVNENQERLVREQYANGTISQLKADTQIAELQSNSVESLADFERPSTVFTSEAYKNFKSLKTVNAQLDSLLTWPFRAIPPIGWFLIIIALLGYVELRTGVFTSILKRKAAA